MVLKNVEQTRTPHHTELIDRQRMVDYNILGVFQDSNIHLKNYTALTTLNHSSSMQFKKRFCNSTWRSNYGFSKCHFIRKIYRNVYRVYQVGVNEWGSFSWAWREPCFHCPCRDMLHHLGWFWLDALDAPVFDTSPCVEPAAARWYKSNRPVHVQVVVWSLALHRAAAESCRFQGGHWVGKLTWSIKIDVYG